MAVFRKKQILVYFMFVDRDLLKVFQGKLCKLSLHINYHDPLSHDHRPQGLVLLPKWMAEK